MSRLTDTPLVVHLPYPSGRRIRWLSRAPILLWRLGLGLWLGRIIMILTTTGRRSGLPRRTAVEFHQYHGRKYIYSGWGARADWYKNLQAHPHVTIQTADGTERVRAHRIAEAQELAQVYACYTRHALMRLGLRALGLWRDPAAIQAHPERVYLITFDPTDAPTPPPVGSDLRWVWGVFLAAVFLGWRVSRHGRRGTR